MCPDADAEAGAGSVVAGRVGRPHGLDGSFRVTGAVAHLLVLGARVSVAGDDREIADAGIVRRAGTDQLPIVRLDVVGDRDGALALRGASLLVAATEAPVLGEDEYWAHDLAGCAVCDGEREVGVVRRLMALPSCEALEVQIDGGGELLVPMVRDAIRSVDIAARRIDIDMRFLGG